MGFFDREFVKSGIKKGLYVLTIQRFAQTWVNFGNIQWSWNGSINTFIFSASTTNTKQPDEMLSFFVVTKKLYLFVIEIF